MEKAARHTGLNVKQELFCVYYVINDELRGNGTFSYATAYGYELEDPQKFPRDDAVYDDAEEEEPDEDEEAAHKRNLRRRYRGHLITPSTYDRAVNVCAVGATQLLRKTKIQNRITDLRLSMLNDEQMDSMLVFWATNKKEPAASVAAIKEFNKLKSRVKDLVEVSGPGGGPIQVDHTRKGLLDSILTKNAKPRS